MYPYNQKKLEKEKLLTAQMNELTLWHMQHCNSYSRMLTKTSLSPIATKLEEVPYLPVQLFKTLDLKSVPDDQIVKTLTSSGTTGQAVSKIYLNKETASAQTKALVEVMKPVLGVRRLPMIILDTKSVLKNRNSFTARGAGILGFQMFGRKPFYAYHDDMTIDWEGLRKYIQQFSGERFFLFGFTYMVWKYFVSKAKKEGITLDLKGSVLVHGGGWKKLEHEAVSPDTFNEALKKQFNIEFVHNYYGMVEQVGSIFVECAEGHLHTPNYADIIIRDYETLEAVPFGTEGIIQVLSTIPKSYPGHSLLTEDYGKILGEDDCSCGWKGKYFEVYGRIPQAEIRGCSDTFQQ